MQKYNGKYLNIQDKKEIFERAAAIKTFKFVSEFLPASLL